MTMAYDFLKKLFKKDENGAIIPMTAEELEAAIDADKNIKVVDLSSGGYIAKDKFDAKETELKGVKKQLDDANIQIKSFEDQDVDGIKKKVSEWEQKYNTDTQALRDQMAAKFTSKAARKGVLDELRSKKFQLDDNGTFLGAKEFMDSLMGDEDYKGAFVTENKDGGAGSGAEGGNGGSGAGAGGQGGNPPRFSAGANGGTPAGGNQNPFLNMGFNRLRQPKEN